MNTYPNIKVWPYNIIAEAMGFTGKEKSNPFDAYRNDLDAVIAKAFREVRFTHTVLSRTTVNRCLGAITDHYQRGDKIREILKDMHLGSRTYYEVLHDVFAQIRVYIRVANTNSEPKASVPVTQPKWSNHTISKRQDLKKETGYLRVRRSCQILLISKLGLGTCSRKQRDALLSMSYSSLKQMQKMLVTY